MFHAAFAKVAEALAILEAIVGAQTLLQAILPGNLNTKILSAGALQLLLNVRLESRDAFVRVLDDFGVDQGLLQPRQRGIGGFA